LDFSKHIQKAEEAVRRRNYDFAVQVYQQLLEIDPDQGEARAGLRQALRRRHEKKKGGRLLGVLKGATPLAVGKTLARTGKHAAAAKSFETYLATQPLDEDANLMLGASLEAQEHYRSALAVYEFLAEIAPKNPEALKRAGALMHRNGEHAKALGYYERALEADPRDRDALKARKDLAAEAAISQARFEKVSHSREQIKDKDRARSLERSQRLHRSEDELREQLARLEERFGETPADPDLMIEMAEVLERLKDPQAAYDLLERALQYRKDSVELRDQVAAMRLKALKRALAQADKADNRAEADRLERELRRFEVEDVERRLESRPQDASLRLQLGRLLLRQERFDEAAAQLQKAVSDPRLQGEALFLLAQCFHQKGFLDLAKREYQKALDTQDTGDERAREILYNLGAIAEAEGNASDARTCYARIYAVDIGYRDVAAKMEQLK
jgi:tetratricopeptide (TPR) repeat protein